MSVGCIPSAEPLSFFWELWALEIEKNHLDKLPEAPQRLEEQNTSGKKLVLFLPNTRILSNLIHVFEHLGVIHSRASSEAQEFPCV